MDGSTDLDLDVDKLPTAGNHALGMTQRDIETLQTSGIMMKTFQLGENVFSMESRLKEAEERLRFWSMMEDSITDFYRLKERMMPCKGIEGIYMRTIKVSVLGNKCSSIKTITSTFFPTNVNFV